MENFQFKLIFLTCSKGHISKLLPCSKIVIEVPFRAELHPIHPGVTQAMVDSWGDTDLVADRDGVSCCGLRRKGACTKSVDLSVPHDRLYKVVV